MEDDASSVATTMDAVSLTSSEQEQEIELVDSEDEGEENGKLDTIIKYSRTKGIRINFLLYFGKYALYLQLFHVKFRPQ
jgi:hypothetical protein